MHYKLTIYAETAAREKGLFEFAREMAAAASAVSDRTVQRRFVNQLHRRLGVSDEIVLLEQTIDGWEHAPLRAQFDYACELLDRALCGCGDGPSALYSCVGGISISQPAERCQVLASHAGRVMHAVLKLLTRLPRRYARSILPATIGELQSPQGEAGARSAAEIALVAMRLSGVEDARIKQLTQDCCYVVTRA